MKLTFNGVKNGLSPEQHEKIQKFLTKHQDKNISLTYEAIDSVRHYQHKYFHGYLLPDLTDAMGDYDARNVLKEMFLKTSITSFKDIPQRHGKNCVIMVNDKGEPLHYTPSMSVLSLKEMDIFIKRCENFLIHDLGRCLNPKFNDEVKELKEIMRGDKW